MGGARRRSLDGDVGVTTLDTILVEDIGANRVVTLNRPERLNAVSRELARDVVTSLAAANVDDKVQAIVLTGSGRAFSAGADLRQASGLSVADIEPWFRDVAGCYRQILLTDKPVVAALNGTAAGAGFQIALVSDWRVGHAETRMAQPEINAGLPSIMGSYLMTFHVPWSLNQELSYSGRAMEAEECRRLGLLNELVESADVLPRALARAGELAGKARVAFRATKARFRELVLRGFDEAYLAVVRGMEASYASGEPQKIMGRFLAERKRARE